ncbi:SNF2 family N-terminal domain-containing protein [Mycena belliarum]|uniref:SNF2 family N-terminal domain-containing protein n=1 Tax=Mycena belliarum TaxID=1033014 RepID=A0AAD6TTU8_9AGAR|nr:SNF2 family N-terminal domain-containing protein [Mycena belliae]
MSQAHAVGYSKSSRAKCHGPECKGAPLPVGTLRYGHTTLNDFGETVEWRHWGCVSPVILTQLAALTMDRVAGFSGLSVADQNKIRTAISRRRVDPSDIPNKQVPASVQPSASTGPSQKRRRAEFEAIQASSSQGPSSSPAVPSQTALEEEEEEVTEVEPPDELYLVFKSSVVGVQYYRGLVGPGEEVQLIREAHNPYDRNAVQVKNIDSAQVGHLPRNVVGKLAPLLDQRLVTVEGMMIQGNMAAGAQAIYTLDINLKIYGSPSRRQELEAKLIWATPGQRGFQSHSGASHHRASVNIAGPSSLSASQAGTSAKRRPDPAQSAAQLEAVRKQQEALQKATDLKKMLSSLEQVDDETRRNSLLDQLLSADDILKLPVHPNPPGVGNGLVVDLLKHQSQALQWAVERENPRLPKKEDDKPVQFWQLKKNGSKTYYFNLATKSPQETPPTLGRGALCADAMGLGKTLTMLALILATKADIPQDFSNSTLIVVPLSVISNWSKQIDDHCASGFLSYYVYYGAKRDISLKELNKFDVIITTYQTVAGEYEDNGAVQNKKKKVPKTLFEIKWKRVVLDEAHTIRNPRTKMFRACCNLSSQRRWALAATPIINSPKDLGSILSFLQICRPLDQEDFFKRLLLRPLKDGDPSGAALLRNLMNHICIRRTKEMQDADGNNLVPLPPVEMIVVPVALSDEARAMYDEVEQLSKNRVESYMRSTSTLAQSNVLSMLTRMRQLVLHTGLVPASYIEELRSSDGTEEDAHAKAAIVVTAADKLRLQAKLAESLEELGECPICFDVMKDPRITSCAHIFCFSCITEIVSRDPKCPLDRRTITMADLHSPAPPLDATQAPFRDAAETNTAGCSGSSAKIDQLIQMLQLLPFDEKSLVFSQFTSFLDKIAEAMDERGIAYVRFDGRMSSKRRQETIAQFSVPVEEDDVAPSRAGTSRRSRGRSSGGSVQREYDQDFVAGPDDDSDFLDDEDDDSIYAKKNKKDKGKRKGKGKATYTAGPSGENPKVMLISLKAGALGLNLTVANNVFLMDPWWQDGIEAQAIDRTNRIGQTKPVHVYQLIAENTVESKVLEIQNRKKKLIQEAFSGMKRTETQRQQKEARLQDLIELFGLRQQAASQRPA